MVTTFTLELGKQLQETLVVGGRAQLLKNMPDKNNIKMSLIGHPSTITNAKIFASPSSWHEPVSSGVTSRAESPGGTAPYPQVRHG